MVIRTSTLSIMILLALCACGQAPAPEAPPDPEAEAQAFAARIGGAPVQDKAPQAPQIAPPLQELDWGACGEARVGIFLGRVANAPTRAEIFALVGQRNEVRFVRPGSVLLSPDPANPRLNLLLDSQDIIRDARCG